MFIGCSSDAGISSMSTMLPMAIRNSSRSGAGLPLDRSWESAINVRIVSTTSYEGTLMLRIWHHLTSSHSSASVSHNSVNPRGTLSNTSSGNSPDFLSCKSLAEYSDWCGWQM